MVTCLTELFIWSLKQNINIPDYMIGAHSYHDKGETANHPYSDEKQQFIESRDMMWSPRNKRPERLRDMIKEMEELLSAFRVVHYRWRSRKVIQMVLSNASIINITLCGHCGDIEKLMIDKSLVGKLSGETVSDVCMTDQFMVAAFPDKSRVDYIYFCKRPPYGEALKKLDKLSTWEPKITPVEIPGPVNRRLERNLSVNIHQDMVLIWWRNSSEEALPWSPMATDKDRANVIILSVHGPNVSVLTYTRTECNPQNIEFSKLHPQKFYTVEQAFSSGGEITAKSCTYEIADGKIQRTLMVNIPLKGQVYCHCRSPGEDKLLLGCADGSLVMYDEYKKLTQVEKAALSPTMAAWHPTGTAFFVGSVRGEIQVFDMAMTPLRVQLLTEEPDPHKMLQIHKFFKSAPALKEIQWCPFDPQGVDWSGDYTDALSFTFDRGPAAVLLLSLGVVSRERFSCLEIVKEYIRHKQLFEAVELLGAMNWDLDGHGCYACLTAIVTHLLKMTLNADRESQLETALGTFYAPKRPLSDQTIQDYRDPISRLARRFFHHLLRYARFDKAFLLAVDIGARDLFMDIHYMALDKGETALAEVARRKADQVDSDSLDSFDDDLPSFDNDGYPQQNYTQHSRNSSYTSNEIPASRQHPWQQEEKPHHRSFIHEQDYNSRSPQTEKKTRSRGGQSSNDYNSRSPQNDKKSRSGVQSSLRSRSFQQGQQNPLSQTAPSPQVSRSHHETSRSFEQGSRSQTVSFNDVPPPLPQRRPVPSRQNRYNSDQHINSQMDGLDLNSDLISDYTAALNDGSNWNRNDSRGDGESKPVNVIHFGVV